ncbi:SusC/RagA family TonB-linked outer membrane protein [Polaribacter sp.]|uniref:SusC/RagA family TonB-linked outer membrane protein n=1 Tax=Polaribacter sp. TaxID=1920175 RepID=UPI003F6BD6F5
MNKIFIKTCILFFVSMLNFSAFAQNSGNKISISGTVVDESDNPLPGVYVIEKGTSNAFVTDFDGNFTLTVKPDAILAFSYIGMKKVEYPIGDKTTFRIVLQEDAQALNEIVIVGYGSQKKEAITGAVSSIKGDEVEDLPVGNLASALVGRVLGVSVTGGESRPGAPARISIRSPLTGETARSKFATALGATDPLYVIDGVVQIDPNTGFSDPTQFNNLDASQVESISFLRDAAAAIYGSRASQGVVLVTTKRGKKGPAKFTYSGNFSIADESYRTKVLNAYEYGKTFNILNSVNPRNNIGNNYDPNDPAPNSQYFFSPAELEHFRTLNYNALDQYWSPAGTQRHNLNISGGSEDATYFGGISYFTQDGNLGSLFYDRWSFRAGTNVNIGKGLKVDFQVSGYFTDVSRTASSIGNQSGEDDYRQLQNRTPFMPMYVNGLPAVLSGSDGGDELFQFHYGELLRLNNLSNNSSNNITANVNLTYEVPFIEGLKLNLNYSRQQGSNSGDQKGSIYNLYQFFGADQLSTQGQTYIVYEDGSGPLGTNSIRLEQEVVNNDRILIDFGKSKNEQARFQASYDKDFGKHSFSGLFAVERAERELNEIRVIKYGIPEYFNGTLLQTTGDFDQNNSINRKSESGDLGYIGRLNYNYDNKYFAEFLFRSDASAKFAPENYWGSFYSISGGWIISKEDFFKSSVFDYLKIRGSVGLAGNDDIRPWKWRQTFQFQDGEGAIFGDDSTLSVGLEDNGQANRDVKWSREIKTNIGVEARFLNNRLSTTFESYYNIGEEQLVDLTAGVPFTVGGSTAPSNAGRWDRWGSEIGIGWNDNIGDDFSYSVNVNTNWSNFELIKGNFANPDFWYPWQPSQPGQARGVWGYDYQGMFKTQEDIDNYIAETGITKVFDIDADQLQPGMLYYRDVRGQWDPETQTFAEKDGIIDQFDQIQLQKPARGPQGFNSAIRMSYKGLSFSTVLTVNWGGYREIGRAKDAFDSFVIGGNYENRPSFWANMYHPILNPTGNIPNLSSSINEGSPNSEGGINTVSSRFWQVSSFSLLMRNINLGYTIPKNISEKMGVDSFRLNLVAINPFILYNPYKEFGLPPSGSYDNYPNLRTISLGVNIGF